MSNQSKKLIRVGVVGLGRSGWGNHVNPLAKLKEHYQLVAVMDPNAERGAEAKEAFGAQPYTDIESFLKHPEMEMVVIATPSHLHLPQATLALNAGMHVVTEKPMTPTLAEADELIALAAKSKGKFTVFQNRRYTPDLMKIQEIIASGELGRIIKVTSRLHKFNRRWDWQTLQKFGGGELNNTASHFVDEVLQLAGDGEPRVFCKRMIALASGDAEDSCTVIIDIPDSPLLEVEVAAASAYKEDLWAIQGTRGGLHGSMTELFWKTCNIDDLPPRAVDETPTPNRSYNSEKLEWNEEKSWKMSDDFEGSQALYYKALHDALVNDKEVPVTPASVRRQIAVLEACRQQSPLPVTFGV